MGSQKPSAVKCSLKSSGLALWQDGGPNCREDAYGQPRLRPEDAVPLHSWGSGHAVPLQVPLRELLVHQGHGSWIRYGLLWRLLSKWLVELKTRMSEEGESLEAGRDLITSGRQRSLIAKDRRNQFPTCLL